LCSWNGRFCELLRRRAAAQAARDNGSAYAAPDGVYYRVQRQPDLGKLSGRKVEDM